jgi:hypothetical protein
MCWAPASSTKYMEPKKQIRAVELNCTLLFIDRQPYQYSIYIYVHIYTYKDA